MKSLIRIIPFAACLLLLPSIAVFAQGTREQQDRRAKLQDEIVAIQKLLNANESKSRSAMDSYSLVQKKVKARRNLVSESDRTIASIGGDIQAKQIEIKRLEDQVDTLTYYYARLVKSVYKNRDTRSWFAYIIASDDLSRAYRRYNYFKSLSDNMKAQAIHLRETQRELEEQKKELLALSDEAKAVRKERVNDLNELKKEESESASIVNQLKRDKKKYVNEIAAKRKQMEILDREIRSSISKAMSSTGSKVKIDYKLAAEFEKNKGVLPWPVDGTIVESYGQHNHPVFTSVKLPFNKGINIATNHDASVHSVFNGIVNRVVVLPSYNICVLVQHGNYFSFYCKLRNASVKVGDKLKTGDVIGTVDTINGSTQLHFEIWKEQDHQNPESWLR